MQDGIVIIQDNVVQFANPRLAEMWGGLPEEAIGTPFQNYIHPDEIPKAVERYRRRMAGEEVSPTYETVLLCKDGQTLEVEVSGGIVPLGGRPSDLLIIRDISSWKRAAKALQESEERFRGLFENATIGIFHSVPEGKFIRVNPFMAAMLGYTSPEDMVASITDIRSQLYVDSRKRDKVFRSLVSSEGWTYAENEYRRKDGSILTANLSVRKVLNPDGSIAYLEGFVEDITERKRAEQTILDALKERETLLKEIYHRVKNNMQIIASLLRLQAEHAADPKVREIVKSSQARIRSMALVHEKLYASKDLSRISFPDYVRSLTVHLFQFHQVSPDIVRLTLNIEDLVLDVQTAVPCGLILNELVTNALKYAFPGGRRGEIAITLRALDPEMYELIVRDDGVGIPEGIEAANPAGFGWQVVGLLAQQLDGVFEAGREGGTKVRITFKAHPYKSRL